MEFQVDLLKGNVVSGTAWYLYTFKLDVHFGSEMVCYYIVLLIFSKGVFMVFRPKLSNENTQGAQLDLGREDFVPIYL